MAASQHVKSERHEELQAMIDSGQAGFDKYKDYFEILNSAFICSMDGGMFNNLKRRGKSRIYFPYLRSKAERLLVAYTAAYFTNQQIASIRAMDQDDAAIGQAVTSLQKAQDYYIKKTPDVFSLLNRAFQSAAVKGTCFLKLFWDASIEAPRIEIIKLRDGFVDPVATSQYDMQFFVHKIQMTYEAALRLGELEGFNTDFDVDAGQDSRSTAMDVDTYSTYNLQLPKKYQRVIMYDIYEKEQDGWYISSMVNGEIVRDKVYLNDGFPIFIGTSLPQIVGEDEYDAVEIYGASPVETLIPLQNAMNQTRNNQIDALGLQLEPRYLSATGSGLNPHDLKGGPGRHVSVMNLNAIREITPPNISQSIFDVQQLSLEMQQASGITDYNQGIVSPGANQTATGVVTLTNEANQKIEYLIRGLNESLVQPLFKQYATLVWKYGDDKFFVETQLDRAMPLELFAHADTGVGATNPAVKAAGIREAMQILGQLGMPSTVSQLLLKLLPLLGLQEIDRIKESMQNDELAKSQAAGAAAPGAPEGAIGGDVPSGGGVPEAVGVADMGIVS